MKYHIRLANRDDINALCHIRNNEALFLNYLQLQLDEQAYLAVAQVEDVLVGFGLLKLNGPLIPKLSDLFVKPTFRHQGIGHALIKFREQLAYERCFDEIFVSVDPIENPRMVKLVTTLHYVAICEPYGKSAIYYNEDGATYEKTYMRVDFKKKLYSL
ncbi:GNAT family N-acetyltransferase [Solibacillus sp. MA9]|uniref:GNAT family N-acetyltransferase n=1 Tax=Solibacillus palustris TaxID=2908203 RepID=A0ABS9UGB8_9BACL|nr:GNAT family N-acetyltransferase [Solibacillus sp. MA9]MCH7323367.1 GNAT family N-acetyltransferase [Solibacillus sp. MA9]